MNFIKTKAIALRDYKLSDQDKIVTFYTFSTGLIKVVAKGARRIKSRFAPIAQFPSYSDILIYRKNPTKMGILTECSIKSLFPKIREDILRFAYASHLAEIYLSAIKEEQINKELFYLMLNTLFLLEKEKYENLKILLSSSKLKFLRILGYTPELRKCVNCGKQRDLFQLFYFTPRKGGILCQDCQIKETQTIGVPKLTILAMDYLLYADLHNSIKPKFHLVEEQISYILDSYLLFHINERKNNSMELIKKIESQ